LGGNTIGEVSIIKERGAEKEILYISITAESSVELITDNICGRNKPNLKLTCSYHLLHHPYTYQSITT